MQQCIQNNLGRDGVIQERLVKNSGVLYQGSPRPWQKTRTSTVFESFILAAWTENGGYEPYF
jgi:hypothetical protein